MKKKHGNNKKKVTKRIMEMTCLLHIAILRANETDTHTQNHSTCDGIVIVTLLLSSLNVRVKSETDFIFMISDMATTTTTTTMTMMNMKDSFMMQIPAHSDYRFHIKRIDMARKTHFK